MEEKFRYRKSLGLILLSEAFKGTFCGPFPYIELVTKAFREFLIQYTILGNISQV